LYSAIISDRGRFLRYLWLLLAGESDPHLWMNGAAQATGAPWGAASGEGEMPLLERLMRTLSRSPETIDRIEALVEGLRRTPSGQEVFPEGFEPFWDAVMRIRGEMR
jgi:hypothetical protein